ncbi:MAG: hypothetical protein FJ278_23605, partial [Planctomycetes bacterium]|nr:hypothetical protein [Planctomycetota bacterium]
IGFKIREATLAKVPYMLVVGDREVAQKKVAVRSRKSGDEGAAELPAFVARLSEELKARK